MSDETPGDTPEESTPAADPGESLPQPAEGAPASPPPPVPPSVAEPAPQPAEGAPASPPPPVPPSVAEPAPQPAEGAPASPPPPVPPPVSELAAQPPPPPTPPSAELARLSPPAPAAAFRPAERGRVRPGLTELREPLVRDAGGYRLRMDPPDLARLRELPGSRDKTDRELGEKFFDAQAARLAESIEGDVPTPAEVRVVVDPYSRQAFLAVGRTIRGIISF